MPGEHERDRSSRLRERPGDDVARRVPGAGKRSGKRSHLEAQPRLVERQRVDREAFCPLHRDVDSADRYAVRVMRNAQHNAELRRANLQRALPHTVDGRIRRGHDSIMTEPSRLLGAGAVPVVMMT
jgi:hypothetical protein